MALRDTEPRPDDPNDPRVLLEWKDRFGQVIKPGDIVACRGYRSIYLGRVLIITHKRKDGKDFQPAGVRVAIAELKEDMTVRSWRQRRWDEPTKTYIEYGEPKPIWGVVKHPEQDCVKITIEK